MTRPDIAELRAWYGDPDHYDPRVLRLLAYVDELEEEIAATDHEWAVENQWRAAKAEQPAPPESGVSELSGDETKRDVDNGTPFETDMRQFPDLFKRHQ